MKRTQIILMAVLLIFVFSISSCFLLPQDVTQTEIEDFLDTFEDDVNAGVNDIEGENTELAMAAATDFFSKGGTAADYLIPFNLMNGDMDTKLLLDTVYGTYEYDSTSYNFILTDDSYPTDGYLFIWSFIDTSIDNEEHSVELLFDRITYYAGDPDEETPNTVDITLSIDDTELVYITFDAEFTTETDEFGYDEYVPIDLSVTWGITDEYNITIGYEGHTEDDPIDDYVLVVDEANFRVEDEINDEWVEYTITSTGDETVNLVVEYDTGWKIDIDTEDPEYVDGPYGGQTIEYTKIEFTGELTKDGVHAADLEGVIWDPNNLLNPAYKSYMIAVFEDGSEHQIDINQVIPAIAK